MKIVDASAIVPVDLGPMRIGCGFGIIESKKLYP